MSILSRIDNAIMEQRKQGQIPDALIMSSRGYSKLERVMDVQQRYLRKYPSDIPTYMGLTIRVTLIFEDFFVGTLGEFDLNDWESDGRANSEWDKYIEYKENEYAESDG